jgi:hypothetical protein
MGTTRSYDNLTRNGGRSTTMQLLGSGQITCYIGTGDTKERSEQFTILRTDTFSVCRRRVSRHSESEGTVTCGMIGQTPHPKTVNAAKNRLVVAAVAAIPPTTLVRGQARKALHGATLKPGRFARRCPEVLAGKTLPWRTALHTRTPAFGFRL